MLLLHLGVFQVDLDSQRQTVWQSLAPKTRVLCTVLLVFAIALTPNGRWLTWAIYAAGVLALLYLSQVTLSILCKRVAVELVFVSVVLIGTLFREDGAVVWQWGWLQITTSGLLVLGSVTLKALLSLLLLNVLMLTTAIPDLLQALVALRVPPLLVAIVASMYRYIGVLIDEFNAMQQAAVSRNLFGSQRWQRLVIGNMIGSLFIRTVDRSERIHQAMLSRGYCGLPAVTRVPHATRRDRLALILVLLLAWVGQLVNLFPVSQILAWLSGR